MEVYGTSGSSNRSPPRKSSQSSFTSSLNKGHSTAAPQQIGSSALFAGAQRASLSVAQSRPRPISSSSRQSVRSREDDFEAALLNPQSTIYLSGSSNVEESPEDELEPPSSPLKRGEEDADAPQPVEKRSYEEDFKALTRPGVLRPASPSPNINGRMGNGLSEASPHTARQVSDVSTSASTPVQNMKSPQVIPPTPSSTASTYVNRRTSQTTVQSQDSSGGSPTQSRVADARRRPVQSLGLDGELVLLEIALD